MRSGAPKGAPGGPRRPAGSAGVEAPGRGENRPAPSLVLQSKESTQSYPDLRVRTDDVGRAFLYRPLIGDAFTAPDPVRGPRRTERLTPRAVRQMKGAAIKAHNLGRPLRTFVTFTVRAESRPAFLTGELVLGREVKRTLNALNEWLRRRDRGSIVYIWAAENKNGYNPHVHMLTDYRVPRSQFEAFATHLEALWGHGFAHIERVRKPESAGRYLLKALGYTMKGADEDQGTVIGNRYGISREILPRYDTVDLYDCADAAQELGRLQGDMTEEIVELGEGLWLTRHGLAFRAGSDLSRVGQVIDKLGEAVHMSD